jgi:hypothetical protein
MDCPGDAPDHHETDAVLVEDPKALDWVEAGHSADPASASADTGDLFSGKCEVFEAFPRGSSETLSDERYVHSLPQPRPSVKFVATGAKEAPQSTYPRIDGPAFDPAHGGLGNSGQGSQATLG